MGIQVEKGDSKVTTVSATTGTAAAAPVVEVPKPENQKIALVIDTNVLLKQLNLRNLLKIETENEFNELFDVITLNEVVKEVKDQQARDYIENHLPFELQYKSAETFIDKSDMIHAQNFAKETGDFTSLSQVDQQVIALGIKIAREKGEIAQVRKEPQPLREFRPKNFEQDYSRMYDGMDTSSDSDSDSDDERKDKKKSKTA